MAGSGNSRWTIGLVASALAVVIATLGVWLTRDGVDGALLTPPSAASGTRISTVPAVKASPTPAAIPPARRPNHKRKRTPMQQASGLQADGSAIRVPRRGSGDFVMATRIDRTSAKRGRLIRFDVAVEKDLAIDPDQAALLIASALDDRLSWRGLGVGRFTLVPAGSTADVHAYIATPGTTDRMCRPFRTLGRVSCQNGRRIVLNAERWVHGSPSYGSDVSAYRRYLANDEFGHALGRRHVQCPGPGRLAPVMVQQTKGLGGCRSNPWPARTDG